MVTEVPLECGLNAPAHRNAVGGKAFAAAVTVAFPAHRVTGGFLLDGESCSFGVAANCGKAYYDLLTMENRTLVIWQDTVKK